MNVMFYTLSKENFFIYGLSSVNAFNLVETKILVFFVGELQTYIFHYKEPLFVFILGVFVVSKQGHLNLNVLRNCPRNHPKVWISYSWFPGM